LGGVDVAGEEGWFVSFFSLPLHACGVGYTALCVCYICFLETTYAEKKVSIELARWGKQELEWNETDEAKQHTTSPSAPTDPAPKLRQVKPGKY
jgi:hypothetical protein